MQSLKLFELPLKQYLLELASYERLHLSSIDEEQVLKVMLSKVNSEIKYLIFSKRLKIQFQRKAESKEKILIKGNLALSKAEINDDFQGVREYKFCLSSELSKDDITLEDNVYLEKGNSTLKLNLESDYGHALIFSWLY